ncbi:MAG TPA: DNA replication protein [Dongiaceae bacterium]|jgi:chromosomal replication initiation ATPase DnaA|nr:DNA replication protein [Dongiaceae bacterium]
MNPQQLPLDLPVRAAMGAADFVVSDCNRDAVAWLDRWPDWPGAILAIYGPAGCGKTHLAQVWRTRSDARFLESGFGVRLPESNLVLDGVRLPEEDLFHLINHVRAGKHSLLILDREAPARWTVGLRDLASRLAGIPAVAVAPPDDALLAALLVKHFSDRQIMVRADLIDYLVRRIDRSFAAAAAAVEALDRAALARGGPVTVKLARDILGREKDATSSSNDSTSDGPLA